MKISLKPNINQVILEYFKLVFSVFCLLYSSYITAQKIQGCNDDSSVFRLDTSKDTKALTFNYKNCNLDLSDYIYLAVKIDNKSSKDLIVDVKYLGPKKAHINQGRIFVSGMESTLGKVILTREKLKDNSSWTPYFSEVRGLPGNYVRHWNAFDLSQTKSVTVIISSNEDLTEKDDIFISKPYGHKKLEFFTRTLDEEALPLIDVYGQYSNASWQSKISSDDELRKAGRRDIKKYSKASFDSTRSKYGGFKEGPKLEARGYFYTTKHKNKWWFVDPDGYLFWSQGITGVGSGSSTSTKNREHLFSSFINEKSSPKWEAYKGSFKNDHINFYSLNLKKKFDSNWESQHEIVNSGRLKSWGINTLGAWSKTPVKVKHPYTLIIHPSKQGIGKLAKMVDPFSKEFKTDLKARLYKLKQFKTDSWLLGVFVNNELHFNSPMAIPYEVLQLKNEIPARKAFEKLLKDKYHTIDNLNASWNSSFKSFKTMNKEKSSQFSEDFKKDMLLYFEHFADIYFKTVSEELKNILPNHLYFGSRFHGQVKYNQLIHRVASRYCDVISFNIYEYSVKDFKIHTEIDKPAIIGEFHAGTGSHGVWGVGLRSATDVKNQGEIYKQYIKDASKHPSFIGAHWFQMIDQMATGRGSDGENFRIGVVNITDQPYEEFVQAIKEAAQNLYKNRIEN